METKKSTLPTLIDDQYALDSLMLEVAGDISDPEVENTVNNWIEEIKSGIAVKVDGYEFRQESIKAQVAKFKGRAEMFTTAVRALNNLSDNLKDRLKFAMNELGTMELKGNVFRYKMSPSKASLVIDHSDLIPMKYKTQVISYDIDKAAIKAVLESGETIPGARLEQGFTLRVYANKGE